MATIKELLKEIDWDVYDAESDDTDVENRDAIENQEDNVESFLEAVSDNPTTPEQRRAEFIIRSRIKIAERAKEIRREAAENDPDLSALVSRKQLNELIRIITLPDTEKIDRYWMLINKNVTYALRKLIPYDILRVYDKYKTKNPVTIPRTPGFIYKAPRILGQPYDLWLSPDIPCYLPQYTEEKLIREHDPKRAKIIDKHIMSYYRYIKYRAKLEMTLARKLYKVCTRYDLLVKNADFYKIYMDNKLYDF